LLIVDWWVMLGRMPAGSTAWRLPVVVMAVAACSVFSSLDELEGDSPEAASGVGGGGVGVGGSAGWPGSGGTDASAMGGATQSCSGCAAGECECSPAAPTGWTHARVVETLDGSKPKCPAGYTANPILLGSGAIDTGCDDCSCGELDPTNASHCDELWQWGGTCTGTLVKTTAASGQCVKLAGSFVKLGLSGPSCAATAVPAPPKFAKTVTLCDASTFGSGCGQDACVAVPTPPFEAARCVVSQAEGDLACPDGFPVKRSYQTAFVDNRSCTGCTCELTSVTCSGGIAKWCTDPSCSDCPFATSLPGNCNSTDGNSYGVFTGPAVPVSGSCTPSGSAESTGFVSATGSRILCCTD
jgi:hypothetical protein